MIIKTFDTYWNYSIKADAQVEYFDKEKKLCISQEKAPLRQFSTENSGKYSSLKAAIKGFILDEVNDFSQLKISVLNDSDAVEGSNKFAITTEVYYDLLGRPITSTFFRHWKNTVNDTLTHAWVTAVFFKHTNDIPNLENGLEEIKTDLFLKNKFTNLN